MNSQQPPPRFSSGGGYQGFGMHANNASAASSTIFPNNDHEYEEQYHIMPEDQQQHQREQQQMMQGRLSQEAHFQQKIAQSMLTQTSQTNSTNNSDEDLFGMDDVPVTLMMNPPWEVHDTTAPPPPPPLDNSFAAPQFPTMDHHHHVNENEYMQANISNEHHLPRMQSSSKNSTRNTTANSTNISNSNSTHSNSSSNKRGVTFRTHDEIHSWDEQLDQLKHVDEEFFNVAHFLLDVVNVGSVVNVDDIPGYFDSEYDYEQQQCSNTMNHGGGDDGGEGEDTISILARMFTFQCGGGQDVDDFTRHGPPSQAKVGGGGFDGGPQQSSTLGGKNYTLTKKLVQDFQLAVKFRMENIETNDALSVGGGMESTIVARTRDIARKIEAYGLPGMPPPNGMTAPPTQPYQEESSCGVGSEDVVNGTVGYRDDYGVDYNEGGNEYVQEFDAPKPEGTHKEPHFFPILPTVDDEEVNRYGMDENDRRFYSTYGNIPTINEFSSKSNSQSPFKSARKIFSTLIGSKTSIPNEEQCQIRLKQIQREVGNAERMMESSRSNEVISACVNRINKLKEEQRMYQIRKERYKVHSMMKANDSESVKKACRQRIHQLTTELETINLEQYNDDLFGGAGDKNRVMAANVANASGGEDHGWYERALQYVRENQSPSSYHNPHADFYPYEPQQQPPYQARYVPDDYSRHYPEKQYASPRARRIPFSPRNGRPYSQAGSQRRHAFPDHYPY